MSEFLLYYKRPDPTTWVYLSSFLTIGLYFVFHRFWSIRNLDIVLLILLAPGLLMVHEGRRRHLREMESGEIAARQMEMFETSGGAETDFSDDPVVPAAFDAPQRNPQSLGSVLVAFSAAVGQEQRGAAESSAIESSATETGAGVSGAGATDRAGSSTDVRPPSAGTKQDPGNPSPPPIHMETNVPLVAQPQALDERLESTSLDPDQDESAAELSAKQLQRSGFILLFVVQMLILIRLLVDSMMTRRPLLDPNLTVGGLYFISISLFVFMMVNVATSTPRMQVWQGPELGPGYALMHRLPSITTLPISPAVGAEDSPPEGAMDESSHRWTIVAKFLAILAHSSIIVALVLIGNRHFGNLRAGVGCALLYLILPYTAQMAGRVDHAMPAALLLWAVLVYRRPFFAGIFLGLAAGLVYYPLFLLPLWCSFYWQRGVRRFAVGVIVTLTILGVMLIFGGTESLVDHLRRMFGLFAPTQEPRGIWGLGWDPRWRLPVIVAFGILCSLFAAWPSPKNLGTLIGCSAAVMVAVQFWHGYGGGLYIAWFLPLLLLPIFRPNLQDRVALKVVHRGRSDSLRRAGSAAAAQAAS